MARILDIVRTRRNAIEPNRAEAERTGELAVAALLAGIHAPDGEPTPAWQAYMSHFPGLRPDQLNRLLALDETKDDDTLKKKRAYLVANGMCGAQSPNTQALAFNVNTIDNGLPEGCE